MEEHRLMKRAITGDEQAIVLLLEHYEQGFYKIAFAYLKNEHDAVDAIQEMTYRCLKKIHTVNAPEYLQTWLVRILINICLDMKNKQVKGVNIDKIVDGKITEHSGVANTFEAFWENGLIKSV